MKNNTVIARIEGTHFTIKKDRIADGYRWSGKGCFIGHFGGPYETPQEARAYAIELASPSRWL